MSNIIKLKNRPKQFRPLNEGESYDEFTSDISQEDLQFKRELERHFDSGFNEGYSAARKEMEREFQTNVQRKTEEFYNILASFEEKLTSFEDAFNKIVIESSLMIAERIIREEVSNKPIIIHTLNEALKKIAGANDVVIKVHASDFDLLKTTGEAAEADRSFRKIRFETSETIQPGGCYVETDIGNVDARLQTQLEQVIRSLENCFNKEE